MIIDAVVVQSPTVLAAIIGCRDRQIAAQAALLRSVTGKLEEAAELLQTEHSDGAMSAAALIDSVLEVLS